MLYFVLISAYIERMKRKQNRLQNRLEFLSWKENVGGLDEAADLIKGRLKCSYSKAAKLATGRYPSTLNASEMQALSELIGRPVDTLFKMPAKRDRAAS